MAELLKQEEPMAGSQGSGKISIIIPTLNAATWLGQLLDMLERQTVRADEILIIDSGSTDGSLAIIRSHEAHLIEIAKEQFDHGGTRSLGIRATTGDLVVFLTQDAIPASHEALARLLAPFADTPELAAAYGRQLPAEDANPFSAHLRLFNYPAQDSLRCFHDRGRYGFKTIFISNSFAAYRRSALEEVGLFPEKLLFGEDTVTVARLLERGWCVRYVSEAAVYHSHNYTLWQDFKRYFDIGALHALEWRILAPYGAPTGAGKRFVRSEIAFLLAQKRYMLILQSLVRNGLKLAAYALGRRHGRLPRSLARALSMHPCWWQ